MTMAPLVTRGLSGSLGWTREPAAVETEASSLGLKQVFQNIKKGFERKMFLKCYKLEIRVYYVSLTCCFAPLRSP